MFFDIKLSLYGSGVISSSSTYSNNFFLVFFLFNIQLRLCMQLNYVFDVPSIWTIFRVWSSGKKFLKGHMDPTSLKVWKWTKTFLENEEKNWTIC